MIHWPERFKWIEGCSSKIKYLQGFVRLTANLIENILIRIYPLPKRGVYCEEERKEKIIFSLTSYPGRINQSYYAIKSLMYQSVKADRIILWLASDQFPDQILPKKFKKLIRKGLEIRFTTDNLMSHKKYYYALLQQKENELVITFDDDLIYESKAAERLVNKHQYYPQAIICNRGAKLDNSETGIIKQGRGNVLYQDEGVSSPSSLIVPSTGAGCLYPYGIMPTSTFIKNDIITIAPTADDLWIWYNCYIAGIRVIKTKKASRNLCVIMGSQKDNLNSLNVSGGENDRVLRKLHAVIKGGTSK